MALTFPTASAGDLYQSGSSAVYEYNGSFWTVIQPKSAIVLNAITASYVSGSTSGGNATIDISTSAPTGVDVGAQWYNTIDGNTYIYVSESTWVPSSVTIALSDSSSFAETASFLAGAIESASFALTASSVEGMVESASFALTASYLGGAIESASFALTASSVEGAIESASFAETSSYVISSSYSDLALTSSYATTASAFIDGTFETPVYFYAVKTAQQTFFNNIEDPIKPYNAIHTIQGVGTGWNNTTGKFTVQKDGIYRIAGTIQFQAAADAINETYYGYIKKNATYYHTDRVQPQNTNTVLKPSLRMEAILPLVAGDEIYISAKQDTGQSRFTDSTQGATLIIEQLSSKSII